MCVMAACCHSSRTSMGFMWHQSLVSWSWFYLHSVKMPLQCWCQKSEEKNKNLELFLADWRKTPTVHNVLITFKVGGVSRIIKKTSAISLFSCLCHVSLPAPPPPASPYFSHNKQFKPSVQPCLSLSSPASTRWGGRREGCLSVSSLLVLFSSLLRLKGGRTSLKSETLSIFPLLPDRMTELIFLSVSPTAFKRTLSYHSSWPPYSDPPRLLSAVELANTFCHFTDNVTGFSLLSPPSSHLCLLLPSGGKRVEVF